VQQSNRQRHHPSANARAKRLRREPTVAEARLWKLLRKLDGFHFRRQLALGSYVFDFGDHGHKLLIELDGGIHDLPEVQKRDRAKEAIAQTQGDHIVRRPNEHAFGDGQFAMAAVLAAIGAKNVDSER
jgi:very-short-patch-repair endonuclease